ncbi:hypothetical protein RHMOL_Rhmol06G0021100 [Rhododendron molle]|uniref:Uncharacterized protein n=1 Tax=Rhododendron molle TaxID=49168 RepID=A0ACC0N868_RHOML|nr:hypothetical protein RHMOL_Rhmol06G0021100 [Rhododendron molle]
MVSNTKSLQIIMGAPGVKGKKVTALPKDGLTDLIGSVVSENHNFKEPFYVLDLGVYAAAVGVKLTTFDSIGEIEKIRKYHPECSLLIRIKPPDESGSRYPLGSKFGALPQEFAPLLQAAQSAKLTISGVSFHVGSASTNFGAYRSAVATAKTVFDAASQLGLPKMRVLNIGGGFTAGSNFDHAANAVKSALQEYLKNEPDLTVISEPGMFFAESAFTLATNIFGKRVRGALREYWINDGVFGSMNCILSNVTLNAPFPFAWTSNHGNPTCRGMKTYCSTVFGPTCTAVDTVLRGHRLPELQVNDWLVFPNMGAYTAAVGSNFNGFKAATTTHLVYSNP